MFKETAISWSSHKCSMMGAALAYYSIFSFGPLLVISTAIAGLVFGPDAVHGEIAAQVAGLLGNAGADALETLLAAANRPYQGALATIFGIATLLFAAANSVSSACAPALPSKPATCVAISPWTASGPKTRPAMAVLMTSNGPKEKIE